MFAAAAVFLMAIMFSLASCVAERVAKAHTVCNPACEHQRPGFQSAGPADSLGDVRVSLPGRAILHCPDRPGGRAPTPTGGREAGAPRRVRSSVSGLAHLSRDRPEQPRDAQEPAVSVLGLLVWPARDDGRHPPGLYGAGSPDRQPLWHGGLRVVPCLRPPVPRRRQAVRSPSPARHDGLSEARNLNPPHATLLFLPFAMLPPGLGLQAWILLNLLALLDIVRAPCGSSGFRSGRSAPPPPQCSCSRGLRRLLW